MRQDELMDVKWVVLLLKKSGRLSADTDDGIPCGDDDDEPPAGVATDCCEVCLVARVIFDCVHKVAQNRTERKPTVHKLLPAAQSDPETGVYERPVQPLRMHRATLVASRVRRCKHGGNI